MYSKWALEARRIALELLASFILHGREPEFWSSMGITLQILVNWHKRTIPSMACYAMALMDNVCL